MPKPKEILSSKDYNNYRNVRAASVMFVFLGGILVLAGISIATQKERDPRQDIPPAAAAVMAIVGGLAGVVGGIAALRGNRRWAKVAYVMAVPYLLGFPLGTILSYIVLSGLSGYLDSKERVRKATISPEEQTWDAE